MKKILLVSMSIFIFSISSCSKDEITDKDRFIGTWKTDYNGEENSTIIFKEDGTVGLYIPLEGYIYHFPGNNTISFSGVSSYWLQFNYEFHSENKVTIYNFINDKISQEVKNITFIKE